MLARACVFSANGVTFVPVTTSDPTRPGSTSAGAEPPPRPVFVTTHWSLVVSAGRNDTPHARDALEKLCRNYWFPIYAFVRRQGQAPHDAQDLTQEFFARLLEKNYLAGADPAKGRFRSFLLSSLKHFLANEWDKANAQKRGGGQMLIPIDVATAESSGGFEPADHLTAEKIFERRWALTLLEHVLGRLRAEYVSDGRENLFEQLKPTLTEASRTVALRGNRHPARHDRRRGQGGGASPAATLPRGAPRGNCGYRRQPRRGGGRNPEPVCGAGGVN